jgi:hypothetical protein
MDRTIVRVRRRDGVCFRRLPITIFCMHGRHVLRSGRFDQRPWWTIFPGAGKHADRNFDSLPVTNFVRFRPDPSPGLRRRPIIRVRLTSGAAIRPIEERARIERVLPRSAETGDGASRSYTDTGYRQGEGSTFFVLTINSKINNINRVTIIDKNRVLRRRVVNPGGDI